MDDSKNPSGTQNKSSQARYPCRNSSCNSTFARPSDARRHEKEVHQVSARFICPFSECSLRVFKRAYLLRDHVNSYHQSSLSPATVDSHNISTDRSGSLYSTQSPPLHDPCLMDQQYMNWSSADVNSPHGVLSTGTWVSDEWLPTNGIVPQNMPSTEVASHFPPGYTWAQGTR